MAKLYDESGAEVTAYLPEELDTKVSEAIKAKEAEFNPKLKEKEDELLKAKTALGERANQFATFRKLNDETVAKLSEAERVIYENGLALAKAQDDRAVVEKNNLEALIDSSIKAKVGTDEKLVTKVKDMWKVFGIEATTPQQIEQKTNMILGALNQSEPDLLASVAGFSNGSYMPPEAPGVKKEEDKTFADTPKGKAIASELGLNLGDKK